jgi:toxin-antitoxin system PIN domain toxin
MILVDANILIYAIDRDSPHHARARRWIEETLSGDTWVGLPWSVILAFIRVTTRAGVVRNPLPPDQAIAFVDSWLGQPHVTAVAPGEHHWRILSNVLRSQGTAGNLTSDAHVAALALEYGCPVVSADTDFRRFSGVTHLNPLGG